MDAPTAHTKQVILLVEDDRLLSKNLAAFFTDAGFSVLQTGNGEAGLAAAVKEHPDIILLDILLPKMDGLTVLKKLRADHQALKIPVILLTNVEPDDAVLKAIMNIEPAYYMVKKDWKLEDILEKVKERLGGNST